MSLKTHNISQSLIWNSWDYALGWDFSNADVRNSKGFWKFVPTSYWGRGTQQGWFLTWEELCPDKGHSLRNSQISRMSRKGPIAQDFSATFHFPVYNGQCLMLPIPSSLEHQGCKTNKLRSRVSITNKTDVTA